MTSRATGSSAGTERRRRTGRAATKDNLARTDYDSAAIPADETLLPRSVDDPFDPTEEFEDAPEFAEDEAMFDRDEWDGSEFVSEGSDDAPRRHRVRPDLVFWIAGDEVSYSVTNRVWLLSGEGSLGKEMRRRLAWLERLGSTLARRQRRAFSAKSVRQAFELLEPMKPVDLAAAMATDPATLTRSRDLLVEAPFGLVPLYFFAWKDDTQVLRVLAVAEEIAHDPAASGSKVATRVAMRHGWKESESLRKDARFLLRLAKHKRLLRYYRESFPAHPWRELRDAIGSDERNALAVKLVLTGVLSLDDISVEGGRT